MVFKVNACEFLLKYDSTEIENLKKDISLADITIGLKDEQIEAKQEINNICENKLKLSKRRQWVIGIVSGTVGVLGGLITGLIIN